MARVRGLIHNMQIRRDADGCRYVYCPRCKKRGPKKHSKRLAWDRYVVRGWIGGEAK